MVEGGGGGQQPVEYQLAGVLVRKGPGTSAVFDNPIQRSKRAKNFLALRRVDWVKRAGWCPRKRAAADEWSLAMN